MNLNLTSSEFIYLLPIAVFAYYLIPNRLRQYFLLLVNLLFYATFGYKYIPVIIAEALVVWAGSQKGRIHRKPLLSLSIIALIAILLFFKLGNCVFDSIVAPLGISFYTLQAVSYIVDVYRGDIEPERNPLKLITYLSFFPTITSGPIYRYKDFVAEHNRNINNLRPEYDRIINGIVYMIYGYFLKLVIATRAGIAVDKVFGDYRTENYGGILLAIIACLYSVQIFTDFAGYSAIVIGIAQILGYKIPENFLSPYMSVSVKEFWGRWHISLSSWLKDYIYIPLGGNRKGRLRKYLNVMITFVISGFWHGVNGWHYLVWGALHGLYQIIGDITKPYREKIIPQIGMVEGSFFHRSIKRVFTFAFVTIAWIFFRTGVGDSVFYLRKIASFGIGSADISTIGLTGIDTIVLVVAILFVVLVDMYQYRKGMRFDEMVYEQGTFARCFIIVCMSLFVLVFGIYGDQHDASYFIYRNF